jgi:hypothetical protein
MSDIICYHCFARFPARDLGFKCIWHEEDDSILGPGSPKIFGWVPRFGERKPPRRVACPEDCLLTSYRVCPACHRDLPYHVGRSHQEIIAISGCQASGKTVYLWALLHQIRERLARVADPFAVAMFEDDASSRFYQGISRTILTRSRLPGATKPGKYLEGEITPVMVRLLRSRRRGACNLIFYDHPGELIEVIEKVRYLRYLAHASAIIYLVDPTGERGDRPDADAVNLAADSLAKIAGQVRNELNVDERRRIQQKLAVVITKADRSVFPSRPVAPLVPGYGLGQAFWTTSARRRALEIEATSSRCEELARELKLDNLVNVARNNFHQVRFFVTSSLGKEPGVRDLGGDPNPIGVEPPLFWTLDR